MILRPIYPPCSSKKGGFDPLMFGKIYPLSDGVGQELELQKDTKLYEPISGRCFQLLKSLKLSMITTVNGTVQNNDIDACIKTSDKDTEKSIVSHEVKFELHSFENCKKDGVIIEIDPIPIIHHAKKYNYQLKEADNLFPSVQEIDSHIALITDSQSRHLATTEQQRRNLGLISKTLEKWMNSLGY